MSNQVIVVVDLMTIDMDVSVFNNTRVAIDHVKGLLDCYSDLGAEDYSEFYAERIGIPGNETVSPALLDSWDLSEPDADINILSEGEQIIRIRVVPVQD